MVRNLRNIGFALALASAVVVPTGAALAQLAVESGGLLPPGSNGEGEPQPANSLPQGFYANTPVGRHRQTLRNYWIGQEAMPASSLASRG